LIFKERSNARFARGNSSIPPLIETAERQLNPEQKMNCTFPNRRFIPRHCAWFASKHLISTQSIPKKYTATEPLDTFTILTISRI
jgi:hypothetical protein